MYNVFYFLHLSGVIIWIGSFLTFGYLLSSSLNKNYEEQLNQSIRKTVNFVVIPATIVVIFSGSYMLSQFNRDSMPLYLSLMEMAGSLVILVTIAILTILSRKITRAIENNKKASLYRFYRQSVYSSAVLGLGIVFIVALKLV